MKKLFLCLISALFAVCTLSCSRSNDSPPVPDTPEPAPIDGIFEGDGARLTFSGDGETVLAEWGEGCPLPDGEYRYVFLWGTFGECRWDIADRFSLSQGEDTLVFLVHTSENKITLDYLYSGVSPDIETIQFTLDRTN